jgi:hypothetical protein
VQILFTADRLHLLYQHVLDEDEIAQQIVNGQVAFVQSDHAAQPAVSVGDDEVQVTEFF